MQKAWNYESSSFNFDEKLIPHIVLTPALRSYLNIGDHESDFVLVGPKGIGKTLFLCLKSWKYRNTAIPSGMQFYPERILCENLAVHNETLSGDDLLKYKQLDIWEQMWTYTLAILAIQTYKVEIANPALQEAIYENKSASSILSALMVDRKQVNTKLRIIPKLFDYLDSIQSGVALFIDSIDQAFVSFLTEYPQQENGGALSSATRVWINSQIGLLSSIYKINRRNNHIKIFTSIRSEAFNNVENDMLLNYRNYATVLSYEKDEIRQIFEKNIAMMEPSQLISPQADSPTERFLGFPQMGHPLARTRQRRRKQENAFEFFYRHTFGRPREIVLLGNILFNEVISSSTYKQLRSLDQKERIRWKVNDISKLFFQNFRMEIIPAFDDDKLRNFLDQVKSNVIPGDQLVKNTLEQTRHYYNIGLIGCLRDRNPGSRGFRQYFQPPAQYSYRNIIALPRSTYYLTHPCLDFILEDMYGVHFYNPNNIIGAGYEFHDGEDLHKYDVVMSFASEDEVYVKKVASNLENRGVRYYCDSPGNRTNIWGKNLYQELEQIYSYSARFCVVFLSQHYRQKSWPMHELASAQARAMRENRVYILPVRLDDSRIPGLHDTISYVDGRVTGAEKLATIILEKVRENLYPGHNSDDGLSG